MEVLSKIAWNLTLIIKKIETSTIVDTKTRTKKKMNQKELSEQIMIADSAKNNLSKIYLISI